MKYCITGAAGTISRKLIPQLLRAGHQVTVVGRNKMHLKELTALGAQPAIGSLEDGEFVNKCFAGMDAVYTMCPPQFSENGFVAFAKKTGRNYYQAIRSQRVPHVVNLSSVGAHLSMGAGHITGMHKIEQQLNALQHAAVLHLRPVYFMTNFIQQIALIHQAGIMGSNFSFENSRLPLVHPNDIASVAAERLLRLDFQGSTSEYIAGDERSTTEIAAVLGRAIERPQLRWVKFSNEELLQALTGNSMPPKAAGELVEGFQAIGEGRVFEDYQKNRPERMPTKLEDFVPEFVAAYSAQPAHVGSTETA